MYKVWIVFGESKHEPSAYVEKVFSSELAAEECAKNLRLSFGEWGAFWVSDEEVYD
jgi:hypothetical protein